MFASQLFYLLCFTVFSVKAFNFIQSPLRLSNTRQEALRMATTGKKKVVVLGGDGFCGWPTSLHLSDKGNDNNESILQTYLFILFLTKIHYLELAYRT